MKKIEIALYVPASVAVNAGATVYGETTIEPTEMQLAELNDAEKQALLHYVSPDRSMDHGPVRHLTLARTCLDGNDTWKATVETLRRSLAENEAQRAEVAREKAETRERVVQTAMIASPPDLVTSYYRHGRHVYELNNLGRAVADDPRTAEKVKIAQAYAEKRTADEREAEEAEAQRKADEAAKREAELKAARAEIRQWAMGAPGPIARAATEEYDVSAAAMDLIAEALRKETSGTIVLRDGSPEHKASEWEERNAPNDAAFRALDHVRDVVDHVGTDCLERPLNAKLPACVTVEVSRIMHVRLAQRCDEYDKAYEPGPAKTGVIVTVSSPVTKDREIVVLAREEKVS